jgi:hypothetical protein
MSDVNDHLQKAIDVAEKVTGLAEDGLRGLDRTISSWPAEFRAIVWDAVEITARARAKDARS